MRKKRRGETEWDRTRGDTDRGRTSRRDYRERERERETERETERDRERDRETKTDRNS